MRRLALPFSFELNNSEVVTGCYNFRNIENYRTIALIVDPELSHVGPESPHVGPELPHDGHELPHDGPELPHYGPELPHVGPDAFKSLSVESKNVFDNKCHLLRQVLSP